MSEQTVLITVNNLDISEDIVFTPNNDGFNDQFVIPGIENFPNASLTIFSRWGDTVFKTQNGYSNDWDGMHLSTQHKVNAGVYFFVLVLDESNAPSEKIKGNVYIKY